MKYETDERDKSKRQTYLIIECVKGKIKVLEKGYKHIEYLVSLVLRNREKNEIRINAKFKVTKEDEFKILIRCIIIGILLIEKGSDILLGIDEKVRRYFMKNLSNRKRIDEEYCIEMLAIEKFLKEEDLKLDILKHSELENIKEEKGKIRKLLELMKKENFETYEINVMDEALTINEFNLFWKYVLITGDLRG
ncbi:uncharacterized protein OCT59_026651 [Rhizophagus irregularis]|nr:hypothetical protein OCT59_026651 [Rhizophagus irregularis]GBC16569.2 hypothetical protein GLOIN_2v1772265 [Rhizophagus irregularis DAOM 181602=DAOM 197198]